MFKTKLTFLKMTNFLVLNFFLYFENLKVHQNAPYLGVQYSLDRLKNSKKSRKLFHFKNFKLIKRKLFDQILHPAVLQPKLYKCEANCISN